MVVKLISSIDTWFLVPPLQTDFFSWSPVLLKYLNSLGPKFYLLIFWLSWWTKKSKIGFALGAALPDAAADFTPAGAGFHQVHELHLEPTRHLRNLHSHSVMTIKSQDFQLLITHQKTEIPFDAYAHFQVVCLDAACQWVLSGAGQSLSPGTGVKVGLILGHFSCAVSATFCSLNPQMETTVTCVNKPWAAHGRDALIQRSSVIPRGGKGVSCFCRMHPWAGVHMRTKAPKTFFWGLCLLCCTLFVRFWYKMTFPCFAISAKADPSPDVGTAPQRL